MDHNPVKDGIYPNPESCNRCQYRAGPACCPYCNYPGAPNNGRFSRFCPWKEAKRIAKLMEDGGE